MSRRLVPSDLLRLALPSDPRCAPDDRVLYVLATQDEESNEARTAIWSVRADEPPAQFTFGKRDGAPRVSPDGALLAFVADRAEGKRIYVMPLGGGEARALSPAYDELGALAWAPDSRRLAYVAKSELDPAHARGAFDAKSGARHFRALPFKSDDDGLLDGRRKHLFVGEIAGTNEPQRLTSGDFDVEAPAWSPDGTQLAFGAQIGMPETSFISDIFVVPASGGEPRMVTRSLGPIGFPAFSHDGREIACIGHERGDNGSLYNAELLVVPVAGGPVRSLSAALDRSVSDQVICDVRGAGGAQAPIWSAGDRELFVLLSSEGSTGIAAFPRDGSAHHLVAGGERDIFAFSRAEDGTLALVYSSPTVPSDIALIDPYGSEQRLTTSNPWLDECALRVPRRMRPLAADGQMLDGWLLEPAGAQPAPYVLEVHGGPHYGYGYAFFFEFQVLAAHGIGVAYGNPRGSQGYGLAYADAITGDWGGVDASDVLTLLDGALANAQVDSARVAIAGGSYGGFMTTWLLGHSKRFAAGVSMRAVNDFVSEVGASDLGWFLEPSLRAPWFEDAGRKLFEGSPMRNATHIEAPLLILHSERDYRCPIDQGEGLFTLLRRLGRTVEFVRFTGDGHNLSRIGKPRNRILRLRAIAHWLIRHLKPAGITAQPEGAGALFEPLSTEKADEPKL